MWPSFVTTIMLFQPLYVLEQCDSNANNGSSSLDHRYSNYSIHLSLAVEYIVNEICYRVALWFCWCLCVCLCVSLTSLHEVTKWTDPQMYILILVKVPVPCHVIVITNQGWIHELRMGGFEKCVPNFWIIWHFLRHKPLLPSRSLVYYFWTMLWGSECK